jgi:tetratricopeptide (TPR) repeat protein
MKPILFVIFIIFFVFNPLIAQNIPVNSRIDIMLIRGNYEDVIDTCKQILAYDSLNPEIYYKMGIAYHNILEEDLSVSSFSKAVKLHPDNKIYNFMLAKEYYGMGKYIPAEPLLSKVCSLDSMNWIYAYYLTSIYMHYNKYDEAINIYQRFLKEDSTNYNYLNKIAFAYLKKGNFEYATNLFNKSLSINNKNLIAIKNLAYLYSIAGKSDKAIQLLTKGIETDSSDMDLLTSRAQLYYSNNNFKAALDDYLALLSSSDSSEIYLERAGICWIKTRDRNLSEAIKYLLLAYRKDTSDYRTCSYLGFCYYNLNDTNNIVNDMKSSIYYYNKAIEILKPVNNQLGLIYRYRAAPEKINGMYKAAINSYLLALAVESDPDIYMEIANIYDEKLNNSERAIYYYQRFLDNVKNVNIQLTPEYIESIKERIKYLKNKPAK